MTARTDEGWSAVEQAARAASPHRGVAPENERIGVVVV
jgi:hypothetical protein